MQEIKIIAFDYDRVVTDQNLKFDTRLIPYFKEMINRGILVGINTGRRWEYINHMLPWVNFIIYENGYFLFYKENIPLYSREEEHMALEIKKRLREKGINCVEGKMMVSCPIDLMGDLENLFLNDSVKLVPNVDSVFVLPINIDKGSALIKFLIMLGLKNSNLCTVGDGENDLDMFLVSGFPAAIGNSIDQLKRISRYVSDKSYSDGTIDVIEYLKRIDFKY